MNSSGSLIDHRDYASFGKIAYESQPSSGDRYGFTGQELHAELDLLETGIRFYGTDIGRFMSEDPGRFTAGDLMMATVLRILKDTDIVTSDGRLAAYIERCTARPAFKRALDAQIGDFRQAA